MNMNNDPAFSIRLKQLQLLIRRIDFGLFLPLKEFHHPELLIGNREDTDIPMLGQSSLHPFYMNIRILSAGTMAQIDGKLEHGESVFHHLLAKVGIDFPVFLRIGRQIKKYHHPHDSVFIKTIHKHSYNEEMK